MFLLASCSPKINLQPYWTKEEAKAEVHFKEAVKLVKFDPYGNNVYWDKRKMSKIYKNMLLDISEDFKTASNQIGASFHAPYKDGRSRYGIIEAPFSYKTKPHVYTKWEMCTKESRWYLDRRLKSLQKRNKIPLSVDLWKNAMVAYKSGPAKEMSGLFGSYKVPVRLAAFYFYYQKGDWCEISVITSETYYIEAKRAQGNKPNVNKDCIKKLLKKGFSIDDATDTCL